MKDLNAKTKSIANRFNISDTYVHYIFAKYVDMKPLKLSTVISIDEVYMDFNKKKLIFTYYIRFY